MGRRRKSDELLPMGVYRHGKKWRLRTYTGANSKPGWHVFHASTIDGFWKEWLGYLGAHKTQAMHAIFDRYVSQELPKKAPDSRKSDLKALRPLRAAFGVLAPESITAAQIVAYVDRRALEAPVRANREVALLSHVFTKCRHWGIVEANPAQKLHYRNPEYPRTRYVTDRELWRSMRLATRVIRHAIRLAVLTGLRRRDLLSIKFSDFSESGLTVTLSKSRRRGVSPKRLQFTRAVPLEKLYARMLRAAGRTAGPDTPVIGATEQQYEHLWSAFQRRVVAAGIERYQMKDLRAKYGTDLAARGGDPSRNLAHSSAATTRRHYQRLPVRIDLDQ